MTAELDPIIHPTHRLRICAMLVAGSTVELSVIKDHLDLSPSALSKQVAALVDAGYVKQERLGADTRRVWLSMTRAGRKAYEGHVAALREIVNATTVPSDS
ncbi:putative MarR-family transcriptional regulator [Actinoplanes missouriensis 431]|uniref:Putative MarR-family transcriptional regulator n=1 Tax=Actinoplanes missouriensis (strain ATCC 14538 / DSM 43046 / CBS 188.64 / JCM 3121 / NBRC 102363 / NCIMB 12654 / NRRL B-3342 / UNCC 431) TaxID=512565 RepID=I0H4X4_ACTM4|nr:transcriptional regulator [Actinoplanes missouriensis]BAL88061.1 putative MarR-family transcriptional regulator [Actinoplanes missouriensis 431]